MRKKLNKQIQELSVFQASDGFHNRNETSKADPWSMARKLPVLNFLALRS